MCQKDAANTADTHPCADSVVDFKVDSDGTTDIMYEPHTDSTGYKRTVTIKLKCNEGKSPGEIDGVTEDYAPMDSKYSATLTSKCACDDGCHHNPEGPGGSSGLSTGSILLIVFFVLLIVYIIGGILINKYKLGVESMPEMCPNYQFWAGIPSLIKDGVLFTCGGIKSACSTLCQKCNKESYANI
ncbi:cation-dependent mannose-6-phosphate receptor-like [Oculina patagonica]